MVADTADINGGSIDGTVIGGAVQTSGQFSTVTTQGLTASGAISFASATISNLGTVTTANIDGGTIDGVTLGVSSPITNATIDNININGSAITSTNSNGNIAITPNGSGEVDISKVDIDSGTIDNTSIGASNASTGLFTTVGTSGLATLASVDINAGNIDGTVIGAASAQAITGTTITANTGFVGGVTGNVQGNLTGNVTGNVTGDLTGDVTGNITASSGVSTFNNVTVNGTLDVTGTTIANVTDPSSAQDAATKNYVDTADALKANLASPTLTGTPLAPTASAATNTTQIATTAFVSTAVSNLIDSSPGALDTLNELAAAIGDDANFSTTITNSIATKLPLAGGTMTGNITLAGAPSSNLHPSTKLYTDTADALKLNLSGGTMSGAIAMGTSKITGMGDPTANQDAATKVYTDTQRDTRLATAGGTMSGAIAMGTNKITGTGDPTSAQDVATKNYIDTLFGSTSSAAGSASAAATSATASANSATASASSATASANSATAAAASYDQFDDRYLGAKSSAPTVDNDGDALVIGALYFDTTANSMKVYSSGGWVAAGSSVNGTSNRFDYVVGTNSGSYTDSSTTTFPCTYDAGFVDIYLNGVKLVVGTDVTATSGTNVVLASAAATGDNICIVGYGTFNLASFSVGEANDVDLTGNANNAILAFDTTDSRFEPTLTPTLTSLTTTGNVAVGGNLTVTGTTAFNGGTVTLGDAGVDDIVLSGEVNSHIIPNSDDTFDLGSSTKEWKDLYIDGTGYIDTLSSTTATIAGNISQTDGDYLYSGGGNFDIVHNTASQNIVFRTTPSGGSATERFRITHDGNLSALNDSSKLLLGSAGDLQLYHDGSNSYIDDTGTGDLIINTNAFRPRTDLFVLNNAANNKNQIVAENGAVNLYNDGSQKFKTTASGIDVTGIAYADTFRGDTVTYIGYGSNAVSPGNGDYLKLQDVATGQNCMELVHDAEVLWAVDGQTGGLSIQGSKAIRESGFGYDANSYNTIILGDSGGNRVTICINEDPSNMSASNFGGNGNEIMTKNNMAFIAPNSARSAFQTNLAFNAEGYAYSSNRPHAFYRGLTNASTSSMMNSAGILKFGTLLSQFGSDYNASTGIYTAPVTGVYLVRFNILVDDSQPVNTTLNAFLRKNSSTTMYGNMYHNKAHAGYEMTNGGGILALNANETIEVYATGQGAHVGSETSISIALL